KTLGGLAGGAGALVVAALSGIADVDAVTISMARLGTGGIGLDTAVQAILIAVGVNTAAKAVMAGWVGGLRLGAYVGAASLVAIGAGGAASLVPLKFP
ncbi:MAG: rane protein, partial [Hyphomicrobiales bacterium]|nr:rane protein [Hyphomicrobiales bacterium]